jgi:hypothetical protein
VIAYKFLLRGAVGPFSGHAWPGPAAGDPGPWVEAVGGVAVCRTAIHACRAEHLPWWIQAELWEAELRGPVEQVRHKLTAPAGRLVRRIDAWDEAAARDFAAGCALAARDHADADDVAIAMAGDAALSARDGGAAVTAYIAAQTALRVAGAEAMAAERARQSAWLVQRLGL